MQRQKGKYEVVDVFCHRLTYAILFGSVDLIYDKNKGRHNWLFKRMVKIEIRMTNQFIKQKIIRDEMENLIATTSLFSELEHEKRKSS